MILNGDGTNIFNNYWRPGWNLKHNTTSLSSSMHLTMKDYSIFFFKFIKWVFKAVLVIFGVIPFSGCSSGYREKNGKVTFDGREITDKSFKVLSNEFAKDSAAAYYKSSAFQYADVASFEAVDEHYAKDKNKAYYCDEYREGQNYYLTKKQTIKEVDFAIPASFVTAGNGYAKDSKQAYYAGKPFKVKDINSFKTINASFTKDDYQAYLSCKPIAGSDGKTFELLDEFFAKDTAHIYYCELIGTDQQKVTVMPCNRNSFTILGYPYSKDDVAVFYGGKKLAGADAATFKVLDNGYAKDQQAVYFEAKKLAGADAASFELFTGDENLEEFHFAKDKTAVYIDDKIIVGAEVSSFKRLSLGYGSDGKRVYYKAFVVKDASPSSFKTYPHGYGDEDAEDANNKYFEGKKVAVNKNVGQ